MKDTYLMISKWTWHLEKLVSISDRNRGRVFNSILNNNN